MIEKEVIKWKINKLYSTINKMNNAKSNISELDDSLNKLREVLSNSLLIDDNPAFDSYATSVISVEKGSSDAITNKIIPNIKDTIHKLKDRIKE